MTIVIDVPKARQSSYSYGSQHSDNPEVRLQSADAFLAAVAGPGRVHYQSRSKLHVVHLADRWGDHNAADYGIPTVSLGIQAVHQCFAGHVPLELRPDTVWYMIAHQLAQHVRLNSERYAHMFTRQPGEQQEIKVRDDSLRYDAPSNWGRTINLFRSPLAEAIGDETVDLFLPRFSTTTVEDETAVLVSFMDLVSPFYKYTVETRCHIPQVRLEGTAADWRELYQRTESLAGSFRELSGYFSDLLPVLQTIAETAAGAHPDPSFWQSVYKYESASGGEYASGWITALFAYKYGERGPQLKKSFNWRSGVDSPWNGTLTNQFPSHVSVVPFKWDYFGTIYDMVFAGGILGVDHTDGFLSPRLGFAVIER